MTHLVLRMTRTAAQDDTLPLTMTALPLRMTRTAAIADMRPSFDRLRMTAVVLLFVVFDYVGGAHVGYFGVLAGVAAGAALA